MNKLFSNLPTGTANERFVSGLYLVLLNRAPGATEVQGWIAQLPMLGQAGLASIFLNSIKLHVLPMRSEGLRRTFVDPTVAALSTGSPKARQASWGEYPP